MNAIKKQIGLKIKQLRSEKKMSANEFGQVIGVSYASIYKYEKGEAMPSAKIQQKLIKEFNLSVDFFTNSDNFEELKKENALLRKSNERLQKMVDVLMSQLPENIGNFLKGNIKIGLFPFDREIANITPVI